MTARRRVKIRKSEPQYQARDGWVVARVRGRDTQHGYELLCRGGYVGWLSYSEDGWRWHLHWSPGTGSRPPRFGISRTSAKAYPTWQVAAGHLARTDVGRISAEPQAGRPRAALPRAADWQRHWAARGEPWIPRPAKSVEAKAVTP